MKVEGDDVSGKIEMFRKRKIETDRDNCVRNVCSLCVLYNRAIAWFYSI